MTAEVATALVSASGAILAAVAGYVFTKRAEREAKWREEKLDCYKAFVASLSGVIEGETSPQGQEEFARSCNNILLFAPQPVLDALQLFRAEIRVSNPNKSIERHDQLLSGLFFEIRKDLGLQPRDERNKFRVQLWAAGKKKASPSLGVRVDGQWGQVISPLRMSRLMATFPEERLRPTRSVERTADARLARSKLVVSGMTRTD